MNTEKKAVLIADYYDEAHVSFSIFRYKIDLSVYDNDYMYDRSSDQTRIMQLVYSVIEIMATIKKYGMSDPNIWEMIRISCETLARHALLHGDLESTKLIILLTQVCHRFNEGHVLSQFWDKNGNSITMAKSQEDAVRYWRSLCQLTNITNGVLRFRIGLDGTLWFRSANHYNEALLKKFVEIANGIH